MIIFYLPQAMPNESILSQLWTDFCKLGKSLKFRLAGLGLISNGIPVSLIIGPLLDNKELITS